MSCATDFLLISLLRLLKPTFSCIFPCNVSSLSCDFTKYHGFLRKSRTYFWLHARTISNMFHLRLHWFSCSGEPKIYMPKVMANAKLRSIFQSKAFLEALFSPTRRSEQLGRRRHRCQHRPTVPRKLLFCQSSVCPSFVSFSAFDFMASR